MPPEVWADAMQQINEYVAEWKDSVREHIQKLDAQHFGAEWDADKHPRGQPGNAGQFVESGAGEAPAPFESPTDIRRFNDKLRARIPEGQREDEGVGTTKENKLVYRLDDGHLYKVAISQDARGRTQAQLVRVAEADVIPYGKGQSPAEQIRSQALGYDESQHPRDERGRWTATGLDDKLDTIENLRSEIHGQMPPGSKLLLTLPNPHELYVDGIEVPKAQRGEGHGGRAMKAILAFADARDMKVSLSPQPDKGKKGALERFYRGLGFHPASDSRGYDPTAHGTWVRPKLSERGPKRYGISQTDIDGMPWVHVEKFYSPDQPRGDDGRWTLVGDARSLGGTTAKSFYEKDGQRYLFKPDGAKKALAAEAASKIAQIANPKATAAETMTIGGHVGLMAPFIKGSPVDFATLSPADVHQLQREHVIDWATSQHDSHPRQFIRDEQGTIHALDKSQAWKHLGEDRLSWDYHPNAVYGEHPPLYNDVFRPGSPHLKSVDPAAIEPTLKAIEGISREQLGQILGPYAKASGKGEAFIDKAYERLQQTRSHFESHYGKLLGKSVKFYSEDQPRDEAGRWTDSGDWGAGTDTLPKGDVTWHYPDWAMKDDGVHAYRGVTPAEFESIQKTGQIQSTGAYSHPSEGTNFAPDAASALSYAHVGRDNPGRTGQPVYVVEVKRENVPSFYLNKAAGALQTKDAIPASAITRVWRFEPGGKVKAQKFYSADQPRGADGKWIAAGGAIAAAGSMTKESVAAGAHPGIELGDPAKVSSSVAAQYQGEGKVHVFDPFFELSPGGRASLMAHEFGHEVAIRANAAHNAAMVEALRPFRRSPDDPWHYDNFAGLSDRPEEFIADIYAELATSKKQPWEEEDGRYAKAYRFVLSIAQHAGLPLPAWARGQKFAAEWDESKHPRAEDGKFTDGEGEPVATGDHLPGKDALMAELAQAPGYDTGGADHAMEVMDRFARMQGWTPEEQRAVDYAAGRYGGSLYRDVNYLLRNGTINPGREYTEQDTRSCIDNFDKLLAALPDITDKTDFHRALRLPPDSYALHQLTTPGETYTEKGFTSASASPGFVDAWIERKQMGAASGVGSAAKSPRVYVKLSWPNEGGAKNANAWLGGYESEVNYRPGAKFTVESAKRGGDGIWNVRMKVKP